MRGPLWRWQAGRQGTGYAKMLLATAAWPMGWDCYVLDYRDGQGIPVHTDPVPGKRHYRLNLVVWRSGRGGQFVAHGPHWRLGPVAFFRSDTCPHEVKPVEGGRRVVLSLGWVRLAAQPSNKNKPR